MGDAEEGQRVYESALEGGNAFTCATCHALHEPADDGFVRPGHPIGDATRRPSYKDGSISDMRVAVNTCVTGWMNGDPLSASDPRWANLYTFLDVMSSADSAEAVDVQITPPPGDLTGGDPVVGRELFNTRCVVCHGVDAVGTDMTPGLFFAPLPRAYVAERVRTSGPVDSSIYDGLSGGVMPFWGANRLSDPELIHILAYVEERSSEGMP
jgi:cytochrome c